MLIYILNLTPFFSILAYFYMCRSGSTKLLNADPNRIRIHNTALIDDNFSICLPNIWYGIFFFFEASDLNLAGFATLFLWHNQCCESSGFESYSTNTYRYRYCNWLEKNNVKNHYTGSKYFGLFNILRY